MSDDLEPDFVEPDAASELSDNPLPPLEPKPGGLGILRLRDYQTEAVDCIYEAWQDNDAILAVMATGLGKTVCAAEVIIRWPGVGRILFIAHVQELIYQAAETIQRHTDEVPEIEMGAHSDRSRGSLTPARILVASIQSMHRRRDRFNPTEFDLVIVDEVHHGAGATYQSLWKWLREGNPQIKLLGITATPHRADRISLKVIADHCAFEFGIREGIDEGWLVPIQQKYVLVDGLDFSQCRTVAKDLKQDDLEAAMMGGESADETLLTEEERQAIIVRQEKMLHSVAAPTVQEAQGRSGIVYCVTVNHATRMAEILRRYPGVTAELICGETPKEERIELIKRFKSGQLQFLVNVAVATEGFDVPNAALIVMARPTKSQTLYTQVIGRGTRPLAGLVDKYATPEDRQAAIADSLKPACTVLDFVGNSGKHKLISTADVLAGDMPEQFVEAAKRDMQRTGVAEEIRSAAWRMKCEHDRQVAERQAEEKAREERLKREAQAREEARRARIRADAEYRTKTINPFDKHDVAPGRTQTQFRGGATDAQIRMLARFGVKEETSLKWSKGQAGSVISEYKNRRGGKWIMPFGKYQGKSLDAIPTDYLRWAGKEVHSEDFQHNLELFRREFTGGSRQPGEEG